MLQAFLTDVNPGQCSSLLRVSCGGEALSYELQSRFFEYFNCELHHLYGPTETSIDVTAWQCKQQGALSIVPIGRPIANAQLYVLDSHQRPVPIGVPGELYIGGAGVARGYLNRQELTTKRFIDNPFGEGRLYRTGDEVKYLPDGNLQYLGRLDNQVKIRGFRIELGEIEAALAQQSDVQQSVVITYKATSGDTALVAYVIGADSTTLSVNELRSHLKSQLPDYMVPPAIMVLDALPLTPNGKLDRNALPEPDMSAQLTTGYIAPRTAIEVQLAEIWAAVLSIENIGIQDNFFELGGHSLLATQLISRVRKTFEQEIPLRTLFESVTIADFAKALTSADTRMTPPLLPYERPEQLPLSFAQQRLWFIQQLEPDSTAYHISDAIRLLGTLNIDALNRSFQHIVERHETLRTKFIQDDSGNPHQVINPAHEWSLKIVNLADLDGSQQAMMVQSLTEEIMAQPFDLSNETLLRVQLIVCGAEEHILLVCMHHVIFDGWSMNIMLEELAVLYEAYSSQQTPKLTTLPIQYVDYALWQREWLQGKVLNQQLEYWKSQLADAPSLLKLPTDRPRPAVQNHAGDSVSFDLSTDLSQQLSTLAQKQGVTLFMLLLSAFDILL